MAALVRHHDGVEIESCEAPGQAGGFVVSNGRDGGHRQRAYVLFDEAETSGLAASALLGPALRWARQHDTAELVILADAAVAGVLRRRIDLMQPPRGLEVSAAAIEGTTFVEAQPAARLIPPDLGADIWALAGLINESGARAVDDHGRLVAEWAGLEVARVTRDGQGRPLFEVGVGQADRELQVLVHGDLAPDTALRRAVATVAVHRRPGAHPHPLNRLARERWLRASLVDQPSLVDLVDLESVPPLEPRATVLGHRPVGAVGHTADGRRVVVVCSTGVDLDLAPQAADYRAREDVDAHLVVVVPEPDRYQVTQELVAMVPDAELRSVPSPWEDLGGPKSADDSGQ